MIPPSSGCRGTTVRAVSAAGQVAPGMTVMPQVSADTRFKQHQTMVQPV